VYLIATLPSTEEERFL
jgi:superfamily II DNA helicase RecQ